MTFAVVNIAENRERVIGTIWADGETDAQQMATSLFQTESHPQDHLIVRRAEEREIPLRLMN